MTEMSERERNDGKIKPRLELELPGSGLLNDTQIAELIRDVRRGEEASYEIKKVVNSSGSTGEEIIKLNEQITNAMEARERIILAKMDLCKKIAKRYVGYGVPETDLENEGVFGLMKAIIKFNPNRNIKFDTYAYRWVEHYIQEAAFYQGNAPHDNNLELKYRKIRRFENSLLIKLGREPTIEELEESTGFSEKTILFVRNKTMRTMSWDEISASKNGSDEDYWIEKGENGFVVDGKGRRREKRPTENRALGWLMHRKKEVMIMEGFNSGKIKPLQLNIARFKEEGYSNVEIGRMLQIPVNSVQKHFEEFKKNMGQEFISLLKEQNTKEDDY